MRNYRSRIRRLEDACGVVAIPQKDGTVAKFPKSAMRDAFMSEVAALRMHPNRPPPHPLVAAARNSSDPWWSENLVYSGLTVLSDDPVEDLSEQAGARKSERQALKATERPSPY